MRTAKAIVYVAIGVVGIIVLGIGILGIGISLVRHGIIESTRTVKVKASHRIEDLRNEKGSSIEDLMLHYDITRVGGNAGEYEWIFKDSKGDLYYMKVTNGVFQGELLPIELERMEQD